MHGVGCIIGTIEHNVKRIETSSVPWAQLVLYVDTHSGPVGDSVSIYFHLRTELQIRVRPEIRSTDHRRPITPSYMIIWKEAAAHLQPSPIFPDYVRLCSRFLRR